MKRIFVLVFAMMMIMACIVPLKVSSGESVDIAKETPLVTPAITSTPSPEYCRVISVGLNVRECGSADCQILDQLSFDDVVKIIRRGDWFKIETETGAVGFVNSRYCEIGE